MKPDLSPESKPVTEVAAADAQKEFDPKWQFDVTVGWQNDFYFRGLNVLEAVGTGAESGVLMSQAHFGYEFTQNDLLSVIIGYTESLDPLIPQGEARQLPPNGRQIGEPELTRQFENYSLSRQLRYQELAMSVSWSHTFIPQVLAGRIGASHFQFSDDQFWNTSSNPDKGVPSTTEIMAGLYYLKYQDIVTPSLFFAWDVDAFSGQFLQFALESERKVFDNGKIAISLSPKIGVSYDFAYNGEGDDWNSLDLELGARIRLTDNVSFNTRVGYVVPLSGASSDGQRDRANEGFWVSFSISAALSSVQLHPEIAHREGAVSFAEEHHWSTSAGLGWRTFAANFSTDGLAPVDPLSLVKRSRARGDLGGSGSQNYINGSVGPTSLDGTASFTGGQTIGNSVLFDSTRYAYESETFKMDTSASSEDRTASPYLKAMYSLGRKGGMSLEAGFLYSFTLSEMDSGSALSSLALGREVVSQYSTVYTRDFNPTGNVITDADAYSQLNNVQGVGPQQTEFAVAYERARLATFVSSDVRLSAHELAIPISAAVDLGDRLHAGVTVAPVLGIYNTELKTRVDTQSLLNFGAPEIRKDNTRYSTFTPAGGGGGGNPQGSSSASTSAPVAAPQPVPPPPTAGDSGGKSGSKYKNPQLPGETVNTDFYSESETKVSFGVMAEAFLQVDLDDRDRWFLEFWGRYTYMDSFTVSNAVSSVSIDPSSFSFGIGLGLRF